MIMKGVTGYLIQSAKQAVDCFYEWLRPLIEHFRSEQIPRFSFGRIVDAKPTGSHGGDSIQRASHACIRPSADDVEGLAHGEIAFRSTEGTCIILQRECARKLGPSLVGIITDESCSVFEVNLNDCVLESLLNLVLYHEASFIGLADMQRLIALLDELGAHAHQEVLSAWVCDLYPLRDVVQLVHRLFGDGYADCAEVVLDALCRNLELTPGLKDTLFSVLKDNHLTIALCPRLVNSDRDIEAFLWSIGQKSFISALDLSGVALRLDHLRILLRLPVVSRLEELNLSYSGISDQGCKLLANRQSFGCLTRLLLREAGITDEGIGALVHSFNFMTVEWLDVNGNSISDSGCRELVSSPTLSALRHIDLGRNLIEATGVSCFCESSRCEDLKTLILDGNPIECEGVAYLSKVRWKSLVSLGLRNCSIRDPGLLALVSSVGMGSLCDLSLCDNDIAADVIKKFMSSAAFPHLRTLQVGSLFRPITVKDCLESEWQLPRLDYIQLSRHDTAQQYVEAHYPQMVERAVVWLGVELDHEGTVDWSQLSFNVA